MYYGPHKFIFVDKFSPETLFKFKDSLNINKKSRFVYVLNCMNCTASYIRVTTSVLPARVQEHGDALWGVRYLAVAEHTIQTGHNMDWNNVKILASDVKEINLFYFKSLIILKQKRSLNKMQTSANINLFT